MRAPHGATALLSLHKNLDGTSLLTWATAKSGERIKTTEYHPYPRKVDMPDNESLLFRTWELLDMYVKELKNGRDTEYNKAAARGVAEVLFIHMRPFYESADDIVRAAIKRFDAQASGETFATPGLAEHIFDPNYNWDGTRRVSLTADSKPKPKAAPKTKIQKHNTKPMSSEDEQSIRGIMSAGIVSAEELAGMYQVTVEKINEITG